MAAAAPYSSQISMGVPSRTPARWAQPTTARVGVDEHRITRDPSGRFGRVRRSSTVFVPSRMAFAYWGLTEMNMARSAGPPGTPADFADEVAAVLVRRSRTEDDVAARRPASRALTASWATRGTLIGASPPC